MDKNKKDSGSLAQQLMENRRHLSELLSQLKSLEKQMADIGKDIKENEKSRKQNAKDFEKLETELQRKKDMLKQKQQQLNELNIDTNYLNGLESDIRNITQELESIRSQMNSLQQVARSFEFEYTSPHRNFDASQVNGMVGKLIRVKDVQYSKAVQVAAGGMLYQVVVDNHDCGKQLLERGQLRKRVTIIPLNKIEARVIPQQLVEKAGRLVGKDNCSVALELVAYEQKVEAAMKYVFGNTFVCTDMNAAKTVAFDPEIKRKCVTMDGEVFNPNGTLTGGADRNELKKVFLWNKYCGKKQSELQKFQQQSEHYQKATEELQLLEEEIRLIKSRINNTAFASIEKKNNELNQQLNELQISKQSKEAEIKLCEDKCKDLEKDLKNYETSKSNSAENVKQEMQKCKNECKKLETALRTKNDEKNRIAQELEDAQSEQETLRGAITAGKQQLQTIEQKIEELNNNSNHLNSEKKVLENEISKEKDQLLSRDNEINELKTVLKKHVKQRNKTELEIVRAENDLKMFKNNMRTTETRINKLLSEYEWISRDRNEFGKENTPYDFTKNNPSQAEERLKLLRQEQSQLKNKINHKVTFVFLFCCFLFYFLKTKIRSESEYRDLIRKREIVRKDKHNIEGVIDELDKKKEETLTATWRKVNEYFNNIFSKVLPGSKCRLMPVDERGDENSEPNKERSFNILKGLEVKVAFGDVWKESLSELSGGQRSLLALSLILSLLLFKPAPMYILDEIDAALDLSHTQNIGLMLRTYFSKSQFIVVSLKEGMFQNANVIFRTKFVDGAVLNMINSKKKLQYDQTLVLYVFLIAYIFLFQFIYLSAHLKLAFVAIIGKGFVFQTS
ncbi:hypothetical protein RFI_10385 [Reticulomyxa filosa]|uniref:SMC hinge domain-containing protein n=1 Tax=Reticulomyxa filosa TaxID=46433 RepID=X6NL77_RETFI|nr:hypothetical protein RFI_10385 [Reticulomyxa filosa]|eukprot:ETO26746.1 hypothetical protein RFI_10385 [Reticulomyxa filosa]